MNSIPDSNVAIGIAHPVPLIVDIPANAITKSEAPSNKTPLELLVIPITRTMYLMNLAHPRLRYERF